MRRPWIGVILLMAGLALVGCGQSPERLNNDGNEAFESEDYQGALTAYHQAQEVAPELAEPHYNAANVLYRGEDYEAAQQEIELALVTEDSAEELDEHSYYNLGNTFFQAQQFEAAIEVYKEALRLRPDDLEAKQNLELALRQMEQQEQEDQQSDQQQEQEQEQKQEQDSQGSEDQQDQDQQEQDQQDPQDGQQQDGQNGEQPKDQPQDSEGSQDEQPQDQGQEQQQDGQPDSEPKEGEDQPQEGQAGSQPQQTDGLSREQARQLLEAAAQGTESLEEYLQQVLIVSGAPPLEDW
jgi:Ca-activated chloride channel family protein